MHSHSTLPKVTGFFILQEAQALQISKERLLFIALSAVITEDDQNFQNCTCLFPWHVLLATKP
jgi:hypothetical protein